MSHDVRVRELAEVWLEDGWKDVAALPYTDEEIIHDLAEEFQAAIEDAWAEWLIARQRGAPLGKTLGQYIADELGVQR